MALGHTHHAGAAACSLPLAAAPAAAPCARHLCLPRTDRRRTDTPTGRHHGDTTCARPAGRGPRPRRPRQLRPPRRPLATPAIRRVPVQVLRRSRPWPPRGCHQLSARIHQLARGERGNGGSMSGLWEEEDGGGRCVDPTYHRNRRRGRVWRCSQGYNGYSCRWVLPIWAEILLTSNKKRTEWHTRQKIFAQWYTCVSELFSGTHITTNFYNDTLVKDSFYFFPATNNKKIARIDDYCLNLQRLHLSVS